jgi:purine-binding chemotaxis protein CheW
VDWAALHDSVEGFARIAAAGGQRTPEQIGRLLAERAERFARPRADDAARAEAGLELLVLTVGGERYAIETRYVLEVLVLRALTPLPATPPFIAGIVHRRGRVIPVLDLPRLLGTAGQSIGEAGQLVVTQVRDMTLAILAHEVGGITEAPSARLASPPSGDRQHSACIRAVLGEDIGVVDLEALVRDPRLMINEESD